MRQTRWHSSNNSPLHWWHVNSLKNVNKMIETFLSTFSETNFPCKQVTVKPIKPKDVKNLWMSKTLKKLPIQQPKPYVNYLKEKPTDSEKTYKDD